MSAKKSFYLAVFTLFGTCHARASDLAAAPRADVCAIDPTAIVSDACASYATLDGLNDAFVPLLKDITQTTDFFAYYRLNLYEQKCPVKAWDDETGSCGNIACKVDTLVDEKDIPAIWRAEELGKLEGPKAAHPGRQEQVERGKDRPLQGDLGADVGESCVVEYDDECDDRDYCVPEDESAISKGDYVSLVDNVERFTGYAGRLVWDAIYRENCFSKAAAETALPAPSQAQRDLRYILQKHATVEEALNLDDECLEKRVFHRIISGMHASISTHICYDYLNQTTGEWGLNMQCYEERLANYPERVSNMYFNYAILTRAVAKLQSYLQNYTFCSGDPDQDRATKAKVIKLTTAAAGAPPIFDERTMFQAPGTDITLKEDFRNRFRNVSRLMDCVGCDKCRLWGKLQTVGFGTAMKILFEYDEHRSDENPPLRRTELVALVNTLDRVSHSLLALGVMRDLHIHDGVDDEIPIAARNLSPSNVAPRETQATHLGEFDEDAGDDEPFYSDDTIWQSVKDELNLIFRVWKFVLYSWVTLPMKVFDIGVAEFDRLWSYWLGLPIASRGWEIRWPTHDEL